MSALLLMTIICCVITLSNCAAETLDGNGSTLLNISSSTDLGANQIFVSEQPVYEYETEEMYASRDGNTIYGVAYIPKYAGEKMPAIIYSHGFGGSHRYGTNYAEAMAARGYVVYCFDFCGGSPGSRSDGSTLEMSLFTEQADLEAVITMVQGLDFVDKDNLFLLGTSQGGAVSALTGAKHSNKIRGMILLYPAFVMVDKANELFSSPEEIPYSYYFMWMDVGHAYFEPLLDYDIYAEIAAYDKDVLLIHGDADSIVPLSYSERALEVYPSAELKVIEGAGHGFSGEEEENTIQYITEYCNSRVAKRNFENVEGRNVKMTSGDVEVMITLNNSKAAADFAKMLPLKLTLIERNSFAKGMTLPHPLATEEVTTRDYEIGNFGYWADGPDLAIFYDDIYERTIVPVIPMGKAEQGAENMHNTSGTVLLELMPEKEEENLNE